MNIDKLKKLAGIKIPREVSAEPIDYDQQAEKELVKIMRQIGTLRDDISHWAANLSNSSTSEYYYKYAIDLLEKELQKLQDDIKIPGQNS